MAELLVKRDGNAQSTNAWEWLQGYVIVAMDDDHEWGSEEGLPKFVVVRMPGVPVANLRQFLLDDAGWHNRTLQQQGLTPDPTVQATMPRVWQVAPWDSLPPSVQETVGGNGGVLTVAVDGYGYTGRSDFAWADLRSLVTNRVSGDTGPETL